MKTTSSFRMHKSHKRLVALLPSANNDVRSAFKSMMIESQLFASVQPKLKSNKDKNLTFDQG